MTMTLASDLDLYRDLAGPAVELTQLRPLHVLELARLELDHHELSGSTPLATYARTRRWAMQLVARRSAETRAYLVTDHGRTVGVAVLDDLRRGTACNAALSVWVDRDERRRGVGTAAVEQLLIHAGDLGLHRLEAAVLPDDAPARGLLTATGFLPVGLAQGYRMVAGRWRDHVLFECLVAGGPSPTPAGR
jgi:ribosomal-protein-alanine N-acetyltransferase